ncbi:MAG: trypsin-like peptidase domain-containing protein [Saprospiraceae bacterium]|nr:trypsin-like peptidase domain-containing protein [Saprospiraceae bacterium]
MKDKIYYFLLGCVGSLIISVLSLVVYHFSYGSDLSADAVAKAYAVAEREIQFSDRFIKTYRSSEPTDFIQAAKESRKAVVFIKSDGAAYDNNDIRINNSTSGSGVIISNDGYIITNEHVIHSSKNIEIMLNDNRVFNAEIIGSDVSSDLALLKIEAQNLDYLMFGNSDSLLVGEWVMAIGNPFKLQSTVTAGIVSAKARNINILENQGIESFIQTDAAVNPGNSGGALINTRGDLVGICTAILSTGGKYEGFSFAIPSNLANKIVSDLKQYGVVQRGWLGIEIENVSSIMAQDLGLTEVSGVFIASVFKNGGAFEAGLKNEDVVISINNVKTSNIAEFMEQLANYRPGSVINMVYVRNKEKSVLKAVLKNQINSTDLVAVSDHALLKDLGFELRDLDKLEKTVFSRSGVMVVSVKNGSIIGNTRMEPGYIITKINNNEITSLANLIKTLEFNRGKTIILDGLYKKYPGEYPYTFVMIK